MNIIKNSLFDYRYFIQGSNNFLSKFESDHFTNLSTKGYLYQYAPFSWPPRKSGKNQRMSTSDPPNPEFIMVNPQRNFDGLKN